MKVTSGTKKERINIDCPVRGDLYVGGVRKSTSFLPKTAYEYEKKGSKYILTPIGNTNVEYHVAPSDFPKDITKSNIHEAVGSASILLIDDEEMICEITSFALHNLGYRVHTCCNGKEALKYYEKNWQDIDLVIIDMVMPEMGGKDAFIAMKKINPNITALLSSGYSLEGEAQEIIAEGVKGFIQKPFRKADLSIRLADILKIE